MDLYTLSRTLLGKIEALLKDEKAAAAAAMPDGCYFLSEDEVLCLPRNNGDARYPYSANGFTMWAYSSGYISINESTFYVILNTDEGKEPFLNFYGAQSDGSGGFIPVSLLGVAQSQLEKDVKRYTVFTPTAVYYLTVTPEAEYCVRALITANKEVLFSVAAQNRMNEPYSTYLSGYFNCFLMHAPCENIETKWFKQSKANPDGFIFYSVEDISRTQHLNNYGVIRRSVIADKPQISSTTSRSDYTGGRNNYLAVSTSLREGKFTKEKQATKFTETAVAGDIVKAIIAPLGAMRVDYRLSVLTSDKDAQLKSAQPLSGADADMIAEKMTVADRKKYESSSMLKMAFSGAGETVLQDKVFTNFLRFVTRQVEFAALSKNSGVSLLGVRDVFQQLEAALMWNQPACRAKILEGLSFIGDDGRPPRQYSMPPTENAIPQLDLRMFIDQGVWIINTVYRYLAFTGDYSILDEQLGYYRFNGEVSISEERDSVLCHLVRIMKFLINNIDEETDCLHVLYGDWNDALDGMGVSIDKSQQFGTGVSVMTTLQLYGNLCAMEELLSKTGQSSLLSTADIKERLKKGLLKNAIETKDGVRRILHGWGDKRSYFVGSSCDSDKQDRDGLTSNAFWGICGAYDWDTSIKRDILAAYSRLDSKYGLKTFEPYFATGTPGVGRIVNLPKGTAENSATYVHATLFGIWSLLIMGESKLAWEQLVKTLPILHKHVSTTQFIMSNSYAYNEEFDMDGESMSDWYTGAANVLVKVMVWHVFGLNADLSGLKVMPCDYIPFPNAEISLSVRGCTVSLKYEKTGESGTRVFLVNGIETLPTLAEVPYLRIDEAALKQKELHIIVKDI